jgi:hypothetical protein
MSKSSKSKDCGGGHKGGGKDHGGHKGGGKDYGHKDDGKDHGGHKGDNDRPDKVCATDPQPNPQPDPTPQPDPRPCPTDNNDCKPMGDSDHHGAVISAGVDADVSANVFHCDSLANLDADIGAHLGFDLGHDSWHA